MFKKIASYVTVDIGCKAIAALSIPLFALYMSPSELGLFGEWFTIYNLFAIFIGMGISTYFIIIKNEKINKFDFAKEIRGSINVSVFLLAICLIVGFLFLDDKLLYVFACILAFMNNIFQLRISDLRVNDELKMYSLYNFFFSLLTTLIPLFVVMNINTAQARVIAFVIAIFLLVSLPLKWCIALFYKGNKDLKHISKRFISYGWPIALIGIASWGKAGVDIQMLSKHLSVEEAGYYFFAFQIVSILLIFGATINRALMPELVKVLNDNKNKFYMICSLVTLLLLFLAVSIFIVSSYFINSYSVEYTKSLDYLVPLLISGWLYVCANVLANKLLRFEKTIKISYSILVSSVTHVAAVSFLFSYNLVGYIGWVSVMSSFTMLILILYFNIRIDPTKFVKNRVNQSNAV